MILCIKCNAQKTEADFYRSTIRANGTGECKTCTAARVRANRAANVDYYREFDRQRANLPHRVKAREEYAKTAQGKQASTRANKSWRKRNPKQYKAHIAVNNALRDGSLVKADNCETCGTVCNTHGHHCDYNKPLDVMWLCDPCHKKWHKENAPIY